MALDNNISVSFEEYLKMREESDKLLLCVNQLLYIL